MLFYFFLLMPIWGVAGAIVAIQKYYKRKKEIQKSIEAFERQHPVSKG